MTVLGSDYKAGQVVSIHLKPVDLRPYSGEVRARDVVSGTVRRAGVGYIDVTTGWGYASVRTDEIALVVK